MFLLGVIGPIGLPELIGIAVLAFYIYVWWRIVAKTGYSGALSLLILVPVLNFLFMIYLGFSEWPVEKELKALREKSGQDSR